MKISALHSPSLKYNREMIGMVVGLRCLHGKVDTCMCTCTVGSTKSNQNTACIIHMGQWKQLGYSYKFACSFIFYESPSTSLQ